MYVYAGTLRFKVRREYKKRLSELGEESQALTEENQRLLASAKEKDLECVKHAKHIKAMKVIRWFKVGLRMCFLQTMEYFVFRLS